MIKVKQVALSKLVQSGRKITYGIVQPGEFVAEGVILVRGRDYSGGWRPPGELMRVAAEIDAPYSRSKLKPGDLVLTIVGANTGTVAVVPKWLDGANITQTTARIAIDQRLASSGYVEQVLRSSIGHREVYRYVKGGAQPGLNLTDVENFQVPLPPLAQQHKIAEILRTWDEAISLLEIATDARERRLSGALQRLLAPARAIGRHIPQTNWATTLFAEAFEERQDRNADLGPDDVITVGKYAIRKQSEHFSRSVASSDLSNYRLISPGDFVYDPMSAYYGALGCYRGTQDGIVSPAYRVIRLRPDIDPEFMTALLRSHSIRFQLDRKSSQGNKEGKRRIIQREEFGSIEFNLPPIDAQRRIAAVLADFQRDMTLVKEQLDAVRRQKRGLMQKLLTGEWPVNVEGAEQ